jgi:hypothetical protein
MEERGVSGREEESQTKISFFICSLFARPKPICSFLLLAQKKRTKEKGSHKSFLGLPFLMLPTQYNSLVLLAQTVLLTNSMRFATLKMSIFLQKRFEGFARLTAIRVSYATKVLSLLK